MTPVIQAVFWMTGTLFSFVVMAIAVRELSGEIHSFEIMLFRTIGSLIILLPFMLRAGPSVWKTTTLGTPDSAATLYISPPSWAGSPASAC